MWFGRMTGAIWAFLSLFAGRFENILADSSVSDQTKMLVVNAAYFVGKWMKKFPESETKECPFRINKVWERGDSTSEVPNYRSEKLEQQTGP